MSPRERSWLLPALAAFLAAGILLGRASAHWWGAALGCLLAMAACPLLRGRFRFAALLALSLSVGALSGFLAYHPSLPPEGERVITGVVTDELRTDASRRVRTMLSHVTLDGEPFPAGAYWSFYTDEVPEGLAPGMQVSFTGSLYHPSGASNPDGYDFREELLRRGATIGVYGMTDLAVSAPGFFSFPGWTASLRHQLSAALIRAMGEETGAYAATMLLGSRSLIAREDRSAFSRLGIAHVLAVSGFHVGVLISALMLLFRLLRLPQRVRLILCAGLLTVYIGLCGFSQPVIRASLLMLLSLAGRIQARPRSTLHLLSAAFAGMLLFSPTQLTGLSFQLSFGAVLGIALVTPFLSSRLQPAHAWARRLWESLCAGLGAQVGILLPQLQAFQELPLLSLLVNLPVMGLSSVLILLYWAVLLTLPIPFLSPLIASAASGCTSALVSAVRFLGQLPGITLWTRAADLWTALGVVLLVLSLCGLLRLRTRARLLAGISALLIITLSLFPRPHTETEYIQFSVGNADAAVLWDQNKLYVIDTGYDDGVVSAFLRRRRLIPDAVILTHLHSDHAGGLAALAEDHIPVRVCYLPEGAEDAEIDPEITLLLDNLRASGTEFRTLGAGDTLTLPSGDMEVLWPAYGGVRPGQDANESSLVLRMTLKGVSFLQTGDLDGRYEMYAAAPADLLKMAHHGSPHSSSAAFLASVAPRAVLLSCNRESRHDDVAERLDPSVALYSTARCGALTVRFTPSSFTITPFLSRQEAD